MDSISIVLKLHDLSFVVPGFGFYTSSNLSKNMVCGTWALSRRYSMLQVGMVGWQQQ